MEPLLRPVVSRHRVAFARVGRRTLTRAPSARVREKVGGGVALTVHGEVEELAVRSADLASDDEQPLAAQRRVMLREDLQSASDGRAWH